MNCEEATKLMDGYLDRRLSAACLRRHLAKTPSETIKLGTTPKMVGIKLHQISKER